MKNINSKKARKELGELIFSITQNISNSNKYYLYEILDENDNFESADFLYGKFCFYSYKKNIIRLAEEFGINFYGFESMEDILSEKEEVFEDYNQAYKDWQNAEEKEGEK